MNLAAAVIFVSDLERSRQFYSEMLDMRVEAEMDDAVILATAGSRLALRARPGALRASGVLGVQLLIWTAQDDADLERRAQQLKALDAYVGSRDIRGVRMVEGRDPDRIPILITYPAGLGLAPAQIPLRAFAY